MSASAEPKRTRGRETRAGRSRWIVVAIALCISSLAILAGCASPEERAERRYRKALELVEQDRLEDAVILFEEIIRTYPRTPAAARARKDVVLYRGLAGAVERFPVVKARDVIVTTARAIEAYRGRNRRVPAALDDLVPRWLDRLPVDPWGNPISYEPKPPRGYRLRCLGADGEPGGAGENEDFLVVDGEFVESPAMAADP